MTDFISRLAVFALLHSFLALPALQGRIAGRFPLLGRFYRLFYNLIALATFFWAMAAWNLSPVLYLVPGAGSLLFHLIQLVSLVLLARCASQTGIGDLLGLTQLRRLTGDRHLVTSGCYARVRHPLYSLSLVFLALNPVMTLKWAILTAFAAAYFTVGARIEERRLRAEFGDSYRRYQEQVPMFIPGKRRLPRNQPGGGNTGKPPEKTDGNS